MKRIVLELTDRCNLRCAHCFEGRHGGRGWLSIQTFQRLLSQAKELGFTEVSLTGGEPTLHPQFSDFVRDLREHDYRFGLVTNGWSFGSTWQVLKNAQPYFRGVTFSMDGARRETHDRMRGARSFHRVLGAASICVARNIPFTINMVVTRVNVSEIENLVNLAEELGAAGIRFGHLVPTPRSVDNGLYLSHAERDDIDARVRTLSALARVPVGLAPGSYSKELFPCEPLQDNEINVDWNGNVTHCCHLSGQTHAADGSEMIGNLAEAPLEELLRRLEGSLAEFRDEKTRLWASHGDGQGLRYPCEYCLKTSGKALGFGEERVRFPGGEFVQ
jgi:MoaA/NifB/PqqE/SkfB family radical SAM enzyme